MGVTIADLVYCSFSSRPYHSRYGPGCKRPGKEVREWFPTHAGFVREFVFSCSLLCRARDESFPTLSHACVLRSVGWNMSLLLDTVRAQVLAHSRPNILEAVTVEL